MIYLKLHNFKKNNFGPSLIVLDGTAYVLRPVSLVRLTFASEITCLSFVRTAYVLRPVSLARLTFASEITCLSFVRFLQQSGELISRVGK